MARKIKLTAYQKGENQKFLDQVKSVLQEGGKWVWKDTGHVYTKVNGELVGDSDEANRDLKELTE